MSESPVPYGGPGPDFRNPPLPPSAADGAFNLAGAHSIIRRLEREHADAIRSAVLAEREACAAIVEADGIRAPLAKTIRARP